jgi:hypothetical protein
VSRWTHTRLRDGSLRSRFSESMTLRGRRSGGAGVTITVVESADGTCVVDAVAIRPRDGARVEMVGRGTRRQLDEQIAWFQMVGEPWCAEHAGTDGEWSEAEAVGR